MDTIGEDSNTSSDRKRCSTVCFAGNGNFGMRLSLDVLTAGEDRVPQNVVVSEVDAGGLACQLGLQRGDCLISFRPDVANSKSCSCALCWPSGLFQMPFL